MPGIRPEQLPFIENPSTVLLVPMQMGKTAEWWSYDGKLLGGICINTITHIPKGEEHSSMVMYLPTPIPRSWAQKEFNLKIEYESEEPNAIFKFRIYYGCGDPSELHLGESPFIKGRTGKKQRITFQLDEDVLKRNELFRGTLEVIRQTSDPVLIYGAWLEVGISN